jgi:hypothetical protein
MDSLEPIDDLPGRFVFRVDINIAGVEPESVYVGIVADETSNISLEPFDLEEALLTELERVKVGEETVTAPQIEIAPNVAAAFSTSQQGAVDAISDI